MTDLIRGKVARILNSREIAINVGSDDGVSTGMYFDVMDRNHEDIKDPDTQEVLGSIQRPKIRVRTTVVQEKLSVASTYKTKQVNVGWSGDRICRSISGAYAAKMENEIRNSENGRKKHGKTWGNKKAS